MATFQVAANTDDVIRSLSDDGWSLTTDYIYAGANNVWWQRGCGMRFTNITIAQGATIDTAKLTLRARFSEGGTVVRTRISAEDVDDAITFADNKATFDTRWANRTTARVDWDAIPAWTSGTDYDSPEIKTVIQEIVDRGGWVSGQDMVIFWDDFDDRSTHNLNTARSAYSYDGSAANAPKLVITWTPPPVGGVSISPRALNYIYTVKGEKYKR